MLAGIDSISLKNQTWFSEVKRLFTQTHWRIGEALIRNMPVNIPFQIDKLAFQYGCVVPDFMLGIPDHTKEESINFVAALMKQVQQTNLIEAKTADKCDTFVKLGIITHYVSDYFCQAHNDDPRYNQILPHILYENRLRIQFNASDLVKVSRAGLERFNTFLYPPSSLVDYIQDRHRAYQAEKPGMSKDIQYAAQTSMNIIAAILNHYIFAAKQQAA